MRPDTADRPDVVWAGCEPHSLWRSTDGGCTFELVRGLWDHPHRPTWEPGGGGGAVHTVLPDPASDRVTVAMSTGGVYVSEDGGDSWEPRNKGITAVFMPDPLPEYGQCVHKVAVDASGPTGMYAQNHFGVFRTDDGGVRGPRSPTGCRSTSASRSSPRPRAGHRLGGAARRRHAAGAAGRRLRVHRTTDAGETWTEVGAGLPDNAWTAVVRDAFCADDNDPTGLYVGTRDGCVYASADEGETFTLVADHLPDVLASRPVPRAGRR